MLVLGRVTGAGFAVDRPEQVEVLDPDGRQAPLRVEEARLWRDPVVGNRIVSMDFSFLARAADVTGRAGDFRLRWGPEVRGPVTLAGAPVLDPARREAYREFRLASREAAPPDGAQSAQLVVVADSRADWYFLWYLVPMALILALLTARKLLAWAGVGAGGEPGAGGAPDARGRR